MSRDSIPALILLPFFAALVAFGARMGPSTTEVAAAHRSPPAYQVSAELTLTGMVEGLPRVHQETSPIVVTVRTDRQAFDLVLAPASYMADMNLAFTKGDLIRVIGAKGLLRDDDVVFVREVTKGTRTVALRTTCGAPLWVTP
jgi:hypothetical protein